MTKIAFLISGEKMLKKNKKICRYRRCYCS